MNYLESMIDKAVEGSVIELPPGDIELDQPLVIDKNITLRGASSGRGVIATTIKNHGLVLNASGIRIEGLLIDLFGACEHGIDMNFRANVTHCRINRAGLDGIYIHSDVNHDPPTNANMWRLNQVVINNSGGNGLFTDGGDVNVGLATAVSCVHNGNHGIYASGFLGSTFIGCHVSDCVGRSYYTDNSNARHVFVGCYAEGNSLPSWFSKHSVEVGGLIGATEGPGLVIRDGMITGFGVDVAQEGKVQVNIGKYADSPMDVVANGDHSQGWQFGYFHEAKGVLDFRHARLNIRAPFALTTDLTTLIDDDTGLPIPAGEFVFNKPYYYPVGGGRYKKVQF